MLKLNKEKENLLVEKYGFEKKYTIDKTIFYNYKKCLCIYSCEHKYAGTIQGHGLSRQCQDIIYDLIKDNVLIKVDNIDKKAKIDKLKLQIKTMQEKIKKLEEE